MPLIRHEIGEADTDAKAVLRKLMNRSPAPTAIVTLQAEAIRLHQAAEALRIKIPGDLSLVSIRDRSAPSPAASVKLATIHLDPSPMGKLAADVLKTWLIQGVPLDRDRRVEIGTWIERESVGPART